MELKTFLFIIFGASILGMIFCTNRAGKNAVSDIDERLKNIPEWQQWLYGILEIHPYSLLNERGKKWQTTVYILLIPAFLSGIQLGEMASR